MARVILPRHRRTLTDSMLERTRCPVPMRPTNTVRDVLLHAAMLPPGSCSDLLLDAYPLRVTVAYHYEGECVVLLVLYPRVSGEYL